MIIGISGYKGHGKDTLGNIFVRFFKFTKMSFATPLRREVDAAIEWGKGPADAPDRIQELVKLCAAEGLRAGDKPTPPLMRELLQLWGTEYRREQDPDYWVKQFVACLLTEVTRSVVVTDLRFPNEFATLRSCGGVLIRVWRCAVESDVHSSHISEHLLDKYVFDHHVNNSGSIWMLHLKAFWIMLRLKFRGL